ncbi:MAG TPA: DUF1579 family protein [Casimicrobiaceae bacterium]|nr:DUF1579 family protein [Casimicrobiaceae bacterium]
MINRLRGTLLVAAVACCLPRAGLAQSPNGAVPESTYAPLSMEEGTWDADVTFYEDDKPGGRAVGVQVNTFLANRHWMVNEFRIPATEKTPAYEGHGVWGYDPVAKTYVNTWVDTNDVGVRTDYGFWYEPEKTMVWSSKQNDGKGHFIDYRITEEFKGDTRVFTFYQLGLAKPNPHPLVKIVFTKRKARTAAN